MKKRILFIATLPPPIHGSSVVSKQIKESKLIQDSFDCDFINLSTSRQMDEIGKKSLIKLWRLISALTNELWKLLTHHYDLCYISLTCHGSGFLKDVPYALLCKLFRRQLVIHQHNKGMANDVDKWPYKWLYPLVYNKSKVILLSWYLYPDIERVVPKENVFICPNGIRFQEKPRRMENKIPRLLFLSNLIESKGVLVLLDALKIMKDKGYSFVCDFVGGETKEIDAKRFKEEVEQRGLNELALYHGKKYGEEKELFFEKCDVFTLPTDNDCFPLVLLEAMSKHLPIVSTQVGGIPDIVKDNENGLIAEKHNAESLVQCLEKLLGNVELRQLMGEDGYRKLKDNFTEQKFEQNILEIFSSLTGGGKITLVEYLGKKFGEEKERIFEKADIFVFPTFYDNECFPLVLLEAMQHGLPIVTTSEGAICDIVEDNVNGLIAERMDSHSLAEKIEILLEEKEMRYKMGEKGHCMFKEHFIFDVFERKMFEILNSMES